MVGRKARRPRVEGCYPLFSHGLPNRAGGPVRPADLRSQNSKSLRQKDVVIKQLREASMLDRTHAQSSSGSRCYEPTTVVHQLITKERKERERNKLLSMPVRNRVATSCYLHHRCSRPLPSRSPVRRFPRDCPRRARERPSRYPGRGCGMPGRLRRRVTL